MSWTKLCGTFTFHPKILEVGNEGAGAFARLLTFSSESLTGGKVKRSAALSIAPVEVLDRLVAALLLEPDGDDYTIHDYGDYNPTGPDLEQRRAVLAAKRAEAGRRGALARWTAGTNGKTDGKLPSPAVADGKPDGKGDGKKMPPSPVSRLRDPSARQPETKNASSAVAPLALTASETKKVTRTKPESTTPAGYGDVLATFSAEYEKARGTKPVIDAMVGKGAKVLLAKIPSPPEACALLVDAFAKPFIANDHPDLLYIANHVNDFRGTPKTKGQRAPVDGPRGWDDHNLRAHPERT